MAVVDERKVHVSKLNAARRQLDCAIEMWFKGKDEVSVHTLGGAAHQIIYDINKVRGGGREMLFDSIWIKDEYRKEFVDYVKKDMNFFKHADKDPDPIGITEFYPATTVMFFLFSIIGLENLGEHQNDIEKTLMLWITVHHPNWLLGEVKRRLEEPHAEQLIADMRKMNKQEFFETAIQAAALLRARG